MQRRTFLAAGAVLLSGAGQALAAPKAADNPIIDAWVKETGFNGVVLLGKGGKQTWSRAFGLADVEANKPLTVSSRFGIASISKWFTAVTVLRLVEQGLLELDDPIIKHLPRYRADTGAKVKLRNLLANNSGIPNGFGQALKADGTKVSMTASPAETVLKHGMGDPLFAPGADFDYSLTNWIIIQAIVEAVARRPFTEVVATNVLAPLELNNTGFDARGAVPSYSTLSPPVRRTEPRTSLTAAAGGAYSNATDLLRAAHRIFDTPFLKPASRKALLTIEAPQSDYALGGRVNMVEIGGEKRAVAWETGRTMGYRSHLAHRLDTESTVVILNNNDLQQSALSKLAADLLKSGV